MWAGRLFSADGGRRMWVKPKGLKTSDCKEGAKNARDV